ncbi:hypothetical protein ANO14919_080310 [Xylariales sp. No.14919]|nr:hypothetical protein ANO14919_080310 [Xylariales sp. No.14919]
MATLDSLKQALKQKAEKTARQPLSDAQYSVGFDILTQGSTTYQDFIVPQLSQVIAPLFDSRTHISVLEIGPGPKSILGHLPSHMRRKIKEYAAFEPNILFAAALEEWLCFPEKTKSPLPSLQSAPEIRRVPFALDSHTGPNADADMSDKNRKYDEILFCHSMYGMKPHHRFVNKALEMLDQRLESGMVVIFYRYGTLDLTGLVCHRTASFPTGIVRVPNENAIIDNFSSFVAGFVAQDSDVGETGRTEWRNVCRSLGRHEDAHPNDILFRAPEVMMAFTKHATALAELTTHVPVMKVGKIIKNSEARLHCPASIIRPTEVGHIQRCVRWAIEHGTGLTVLAGGHSGHCLLPSIVAVDMGAFDQVYILAAGDGGGDAAPSSSPLVVVEAGCKTGDIILKTMMAGLTVPLGSRPSVGGGLWLQGGIGHLARLYGLACDSIVGGVVVSVSSGQVLLVGYVPSQYQPAGAVRPENEADLLWALKGAGTNFGIVISVTFKAHAALHHLTRNWVFPLGDNLSARGQLGDFDRLAVEETPPNGSVDVYLYYDGDQLRCGVTIVGSSTDRLALETPSPTAALTLGQEGNTKIVDGVGLFETDMYMYAMHGGHGGGKTSSFKRCLFFNKIGIRNIADIMVKAVESRPSPLCYIHLLHGGGAVRDVAADATAFGCRDWIFACVITGVWLRNEDGNEIAREVVEWVYNVAMDLLPLSAGVYGADLGPDPRDIPLVARAFGPNLPRLACLKRKLDPHHVLAYSCPITKVLSEPRVIILVTGESCAGKDYCAGILASMLENNHFTATNLTVRVVSISDEAKRAYAEVTGANLDRLLHDRAYKEQHRPVLTAFFQGQVRERPQLPMEHFLNIVRSANNIDVLLITGMRDEAPVATLSHLVPNSRLLEIQVQASEETRLARQGGQDNGQKNNETKDSKDDDGGRSKPKTMNYSPSLIFNNETVGDETAKAFTKQYLLPFFDEDLQRLANMVRPIPGFPRQGIDFQHVLGIAQRPSGLALCTSLLRKHFTGDWVKVGAIVCCEAGGFVFAPALASEVNVRLALIREAGKLPPPTFSVAKYPSHISSASHDEKEKIIEIGQDIVPKGAPVVVVDDVLATGETLCAVIQLLIKAGVNVEDITIMIVAEFPVHRGRKLLFERGFGRANIQSLLVYGGA